MNTVHWPSVAPASVLHSSATSTTCSRLKSSCGAAIMATAATSSNIPKQIKRDMILFFLFLSNTPETNDLYLNDSNTSSIVVL